MIHTSLEFLTHELNEYLMLKTGTSDERIFMTNVANDEGVAIPGKSLGLSLINIEEERTFKEQKATSVNIDGDVIRRNSEIKMNLYILITANFQEDNVSEESNSKPAYLDGLKQLSYVISFFQAKNVFNAANSPSMAGFDSEIKRLIVELYSYDFDQLNNFWSVLGTNYLPSVLYKVRSVRFQEDAILDSNLPIERISLKTGGN